MTNVCTNLYQYNNSKNIQIIYIYIYDFVESFILSSKWEGFSNPRHMAKNRVHLIKLGSTIITIDKWTAGSTTYLGLKKINERKSPCRWQTLLVAALDGCCFFEVTRMRNCRQYRAVKMKYFYKGTCKISVDFNCAQRVKHILNYFD